MSLMVWPRAGVVSLGLTRNALASNATDCVAVSAPSVASTYEVYVPGESIVPSVRRPSKAQVCAPAGRATAGEVRDDHPARGIADRPGDGHRPSQLEGEGRGPREPIEILGIEDRGGACDPFQRGHEADGSLLAGPDVAGGVHRCDRHDVATVGRNRAGRIATVPGDVRRRAARGDRPGLEDRPVGVSDGHRQGARFGGGGGQRHRVLIAVAIGGERWTVVGAGAAHGCEGLVTVIVPW